MSSSDDSTAPKRVPHSENKRSRFPVILIALALFAGIAVAVSPLGDPLRTAGSLWNGLFANHEDRSYRDLVHWSAEENLAFKKEAHPWLPADATDIALRTTHDAQGWALSFDSDALQPAGCTPIEATIAPVMDVTWLPNPGTSGWSCGALTVQGTEDGFAAWMP
ncbi:hypothetical protein [Arthrobacter flavus]|uniref:Uncharacterized protein n=1 Tax=Arthrobacter flavus TaxID=95172 RepID=A0ABW4Q557_9MICC